MKKALKLAGIAVAIAVVTAAVAFLPSFVSVARVGPYYQTQMPFDSLTGAQPGGAVRTWLNCLTDTLLVGDVVYVATANHVCKSATASFYKKYAGIVVGGAFTGMRAVTTKPDTGAIADTAALSGQRVIVMYCGRTWTRADTAISPGGRLVPSASHAGWVKGLTSAFFGDSLNGLGYLVDSAVTQTQTLVHFCK